MWMASKTKSMLSSKSRMMLMSTTDQSIIPWILLPNLSKLALMFLVLPNSINFKPMGSNSKLVMTMFPTILIDFLSVWWEPLRSFLNSEEKCLHSETGWRRLTKFWRIRKDSLQTSTKSKEIQVT